MNSRGQFIRERFNALVEHVWSEIGPDDRVTSTYTLHRRQTVTSTTGLGIPKTPWTPVLLNEPCMFIGEWSASAQRFGLDPGGKSSQTLLVLWTTYTDVHPGDDLFLAFDSKHYHVREVQQEGGLYRLLCDSELAQNTSP